MSSLRRSAIKKAGGMPNDKVYELKEAIPEPIRKYKKVVRVKHFRPGLNSYEAARYSSVALSLISSNSVEVTDYDKNKASVITEQGNAVIAFAEKYKNLLTTTRIISEDHNTFYVSYPLVDPQKIKVELTDTLK